MMEIDNEYLVEIASTDEICLSKFKSPRDPRILDAMRKFDRADFLPADIELIAYVTRALNLISFSESCSKLSDLDEQLRELEVEGDVSVKLGQEYKEAVGNVLQGFRDVLSETRLGKIPIRLIAYDNAPLPIGYDQTCSQPSLIGAMCDILELEPGMRVLEIGTGCGYHAAIVSHLIGEQGLLVTIEIRKLLFDLARNNLEAHFGEGVWDRIKIIYGDGYRGCPNYQPFDRIYLTAGVSESFDSSTLEEQLNKDNGILLVPPMKDDLFGIFYKDGEREVREYGWVGFVPLVGDNT